LELEPQCRRRQGLSRFSLVCRGSPSVRNVALIFRRIPIRSSIRDAEPDGNPSSPSALCGIRFVGAIIFAASCPMLSRDALTSASTPHQRRDAKQSQTGYEQHERRRDRYGVAHKEDGRLGGDRRGRCEDDSKHEQHGAENSPHLEVAYRCRGALRFRSRLYPEEPSSASQQRLQPVDMGPTASRFAESCSTNATGSCDQPASTRLPSEESTTTVASCSLLLAVMRHVALGRLPGVVARMKVPCAT